MKKYKKYLTSGVLAAAMATSILSVPTNHVATYAATPQPTDSQIKVGEILSVGKIKPTGKLDVDINLPEATASVLGSDPSKAEVSVKVVDPNDKVLTVGEDGQTDPETGDPIVYDVVYTPGAGYKFRPTKVGKYKVTYTAKTADATTTSETYHILVSSDTYKMALKVNDSVILPSYVDTNATRGVKDIVIPQPDVYNEQGVLVLTNGSYNPAFDDPEFKELTASQIEWYKECHVEVSVETPKEDGVLSSADGTLTKDTASGLYKFTPLEGTNVIVYTLKHNSTTLQTITRSVIGSNNYNKNEIEVRYTIPNATTTASLNDKAYLPLASAYNKNDANNTINVHTQVKVEYRDGSNLINVSVKSDAEGLYFIPEFEGNYKITYNVTDFYGNKGEEHSYTIESVKDSVAPEMFVVKGYNYTDGQTSAIMVDMHSAKYLIPNKVGKNKGSITFPAIYATDSVTDLSDFTFTRQITSTVLDNRIDLQSNSYHDADSDPATNDFTAAEKAAREVVLDLKDLEPGDYTVTYRVQDESGARLSTSWSTTFTLYDDLSDDIAPTIQYGENFPTVANENSVIKFVKPTISDDTAKEISKRYFVEFDGMDKLYEIQEDSTDANYLSFDMSTKVDLGSGSSSSLYDLALGNNDKLKVTTYVEDAYANTAKLSKTIKVIDTSDNSIPTIIDIDSSATNNSYNQYSTVKVNGVTFQDNDANLRIIATIRDSQGNIITGYNTLGNIDRVESSTIWTHVHPGISFTANKAESYTVTYSAVDSGNNSTSVTVVLPSLTDKQAPEVIGVAGNKTITMELGEVKDLGLAEVKDNLEASDENPLTLTVTCLEEPTYLTNNSIFAPLKTGEYTIVYKATDGQGNPSEEVQVKVIVKDTKAPKLIVGNGYGYQKEITSDPSGQPKDDQGNKLPFTTIKLPNFTSYDDDHGFGIASGSLNMGATAKLVVSGPDGKEYTVGNTNEKYELKPVGDSYTFVPNVKGTYIATYSSVDYSGNKAEDQVITIYVGDTVKPTVNYTGKINKRISLKDGKFVLDLTNINVTDAQADKPEELTWNSISFVNKAGNAVNYKESDDKYIRTYTFDAAGVYTLTITARDEAGNIGTYNLEVTVVGEDAETEYTEEVTGVILIVVSLVILAGVILYFAKGKLKRRKGKKSKKSTKKVEEKTESNEEK